MLFFSCCFSSVFFSREYQQTRVRFLTSTVNVSCMISVYSLSLLLLDSILSSAYAGDIWGALSVSALHHLFQLSLFLFSTFLHRQKCVVCYNSRPVQLQLQLSFSRLLLCDNLSHCCFTTVQLLSMLSYETIS